MATTELPDISNEALEAEKKAISEGKEPEKDVEVEIIDDTPPQDRGRDPLPKELVNELEQDDLDEYSDKVKKRLSQMKKVWHDERRAKEQAAREREEAIAFARAKDAEVKALKSKLGHGEKAYTTAMIEAADREILAAKEKLKQAYETGDSGAIADAQEALTDVKVRRRELDYRRPALQEQEEGVQPQQQAQAPAQQQAVVDPKAQAWRERNDWFGSDEEMTSLALGLHEKLVRSGVDPRSDEYYKKIDEGIRKRFPENFETDEPKQETTEREASAPRKKTVVAAVSRTTAPNKVRLTASQAAIAKRLGLTPEAYAKEVVKLENANG